MLRIQNFVKNLKIIFLLSNKLLQVTIKCTDVNGIRKEKTALVIPNAVQVCTETEKVG